MFSVNSQRVGSLCQEGSAWDGTVQTPVWAWHCMWVPAPHPALGAASKRGKSISKTVVVVVVTLPWLSSKLVVGALGKPL